MTKNPRNHLVWSLKEIEADPMGYTVAQRAHREDQARERQQPAALDAYRERRNEQTAQAAHQQPTPWSKSAAKK